MRGAACGVWRPAALGNPALVLECIGAKDLDGMVDDRIEGGEAVLDPTGGAGEVDD
jgi:hypothetical protein